MRSLWFQPVPRIVGNPIHAVTMPIVFGTHATFRGHEIDVPHCHFLKGRTIMLNVSDDLNLMNLSPEKRAAVTKKLGEDAEKLSRAGKKLLEAEGFSVEEAKEYAPHVAVMYAGAAIGACIKSKVKKEEAHALVDALYTAVADGSIFESGEPA